MDHEYIEFKLNISQKLELSYEATKFGQVVRDLNSMLEVMSLILNSIVKKKEL
jgi:hypothetical protein